MLFSEMLKKQSKYRIYILASIPVFLLVLALLHGPVLNRIADGLVYKDDIKPSDAIVVLTGDSTGERLATAISLFKKGYGKYIVFSGGSVYWKANYADLYLEQLKASSVGPEFAVYSTEPLPQVSTEGEALVNIRLLKEKGAKSFILVTSDFHTARSRFVYAPLAQKNGMIMYVYPARDSTVKLREWWKDRESAKTVFIEIEKTVWYKLFQ